MSYTVLTWDGEPSAVSQDAIKDSRLARTQTVVDDWDEEFDRGKVWCVAVTVDWGSRQPWFCLSFESSL